MAQAKGSRKKTGGSRKNTTVSSGRKNAGIDSGRKAAGKGFVKKNTHDDKIKKDIELLVVLAVCILLFISNLGVGGAVGRACSMFFFGMMGLPAYVFPVLFFYLYIFVMANGSEKEAVKRVVAIVGIAVFACAFFQLITYSYVPGASWGEIYTECGLDRAGGGLIGALFVQVFGRAFGVPGAYVLILIGLVIFSILLTQKPLVTVFREQSEKAYGSARERHEKHTEEASARKNEKAIALESIRADRERRKAIEESRKARRLSAKAATARARMVDPQTITDTGSGEAVPSAQILPAAENLPSTEDLSAAEKKSAAENNPAAESVRPSMVDMETGEILVSDVPDDIIENGHEITEPQPVEEIPFEEVNGEDVAFDPIENSDIGEIPTAGSHEAHGSRGDSKAESKSKSASNAASNTEAKPDTNAGTVVPDIAVPEEEEPEEYIFPSTDLLREPKGGQSGDTNEQLRETAQKLETVLGRFGAPVTTSHISCGPTVTRYELTPHTGVKVSKIVGLADDIKLNLAAADIRIEAPIPGKSAIGIEVPNKTNSAVMLRELIESQAFQRHKSKLAFAVGKDIAGQPVVTDIAKMPHLLIAGATGSGKSVCINTMIVSILYKSRPDEVKFIMIDPKVVELSVYNGIPHLLIPVVTDPKKAAGALNWAVAEMTDRYQKFAEFGVRDLTGYNAKLETLPEPEEGKVKPKKMPRIVIVVDELADLMMVAQNEVEDAICRLAQLARAAGIHIIIATQRPSVNVITGLIKANMPSRIALSVTSGVDSRTILDMNGAEKLLGKGDMLFYPQGYQKPARVQGAFVSDDEIADIVGFLKGNRKNHDYSQEIQEKINSSAFSGVSAGADGGAEAGDTDAYFPDAGKLIIEKDKASIGMLQRAFRIGFNRAARIMDQLCDAGVVGEEEGTKPRKVLMTMEEFDNYLEEN